MRQMSEQNKLLASLVVFRDIYDTNNDIYEIIVKFINAIIISKGLTNFSLPQICEYLNSSYGFSLPTAVVITALNRMKLRRKDGNYFVNDGDFTKNDDFYKTIRTNLDANNRILDQLIRFIQTEKRTNLKTNEKESVIDAFCHFLLNGTDNTSYSEYVSAFVLKNENDDNFRRELNRIREGVILYTGINYCNLGEIGSWKAPLTIVVDTEILFHFTGLNGSLYKSQFEDFFRFVKEINEKAKRILVTLRYFPETANEIDQFFHSAEEIVVNKQVDKPQNTAMTEIVSGCKTGSDVVQKRSDFYYQLKMNNILEFSRKEIDLNEDHSLNIISSEVAQYFEEKYTEDVTVILDYLNRINHLRQKEIADSFENSRYILVTGKNITINIGKEIQTDSKAPLAVSLLWITNQFWFKLNKGFGDGNFPASFDVIAKAQSVLAADLRRSIGEDFDELQHKFQLGEISEEQAQARLLDLRSKVKKPEEINSDDVFPIMNIIAGDSLESFLEQYEFTKTAVEKTLIENEDLKSQIEELKTEAKNEKVSQIATEELLIKTLKSRLSEDDATIQKLESNQALLDKKTETKFKIFKSIVIFISAAIFVGVIYLFYYWSIDILWFLTPFVFFIGLIYVISNEKNLKIQPLEILSKIKEKMRNQVYQKNGFDPQLIEKLKISNHDLDQFIKNFENTN